MYFNNYNVTYQLFIVLLQILSIFLACASAQYYPTGYYGYPSTSQYHAQDIIGQASYGYAYPGQAASNYRDALGNQVGSYAYMGPNGEVRVNYVADALGFRVLSNNLPVAPEDTPEVAAAKIEHARLVEEAAAKKAAEPVASRKKRQVPFYPSALPYSTYPYGPAFYNYVAPTPLVAKTTVKTVTVEADLESKTPADTQKFDLKEKSFDVVTPLAYQTPLAYANAYPYYNGYYGY